MQGNAPRVSERAQGCQQHRRECCHRVPDVQLPSDLATRPSPWTSGLADGIGRNAVIAVPDVKRPSEFAVAARCNTSSIEAEVDPAGSCKETRREPEKEHGASSGIGGNPVIVISDVKLLSGIFTLPSPWTSGMRAASAGMPASGFPMSNCHRALQFPSPPSTSGSPAASAGMLPSRFPMSNFYRAFSPGRRRQQQRGCEPRRRGP